MAKERKQKVDKLLDGLLEGKKPDEILGSEGCWGSLNLHLMHSEIPPRVAHAPNATHEGAKRAGHNTIAGVMLGASPFTSTGSLSRHQHSNVL